MSDPAQPEKYWQDTPVTVEWMGRARYADILAQARRDRESYLSGEPIREYIRFYEHPWVLTTGRRAVADLPPPGFWREKDFDTCETERGGLATLHGPGQIVAWMMVDLSARGLGSKRAVDAIEEGVISSLVAHGVSAARRRGAPGVWVGRDKIASIGLHIRQGVTLHGFAINFDIDPTPFEWFVPCGVEDGGTTTMKAWGADQMRRSDLAIAAGHSVLWAMLQSTIDSANGRQ